MNEPPEESKECQSERRPMSPFKSALLQYEDRLLEGVKRELDKLNKPLSLSESLIIRLELLEKQQRDSHDIIMKLHEELHSLLKHTKNVEQLLQSKESKEGEKDSSDKSKRKSQTSANKKK